MIVLDPGHGGADPGGGTNDLWKEKNMNLDISKHQFNRFNQLGIPVKMTRYTDMTLSPKERVKLVNEAFGRTEDVITLSNHTNSGGGQGSELIHSIQDTDELSNDLSDELFKAGQNTRAIYTRKNRLGNDYYFIQRDTRPIQSIIVEYGFADNPIDKEKLYYNWPNYAEAVVKGTTGYLNQPYLPPKYITYIVRPNDSLFTIAKKTNSTINNLKTINNLSSDSLTPGQRIMVPFVEPKDFEIYTVQENDSAFLIAQKFGITVPELLDANGLKSPSLVTGQKIKIPRG
ncbi:LysM peptidoglycan-binding domain-containing protein [Mycoplasmatota bacterium WC44]